MLFTEQEPEGSSIESLKVSVGAHLLSFSFQNWHFTIQLILLDSLNSIFYWLMNSCGGPVSQQSSGFL